MKRTTTHIWTWTSALTWGALFVAGCDPGDTTPTVNPVAALRVQNPKFAAEAGISADIDPSPDNTVQAISKKKYFAYRGDAFALLPVERLFDRMQSSSRLVADSGGYSSYFTMPEDPQDIGPVMEPLPAWRLAGVVIADGVAALLDMGSRVIEIRPGMKIPDTDWTVASIDSERAILKRSGNKLPKTFVVPLQGANPLGGGGSGGGTGGSGGGSSGGNGGPKKGGPVGAGS